jgi:hypothetical protein
MNKIIAGDDLHHRPNIEQVDEATELGQHNLLISKVNSALAYAQFRSLDTGGPQDA